MVPITLDGKLVYGVLVADGAGARLRLSLDEADQLGLVPGRQVRIEAPGQSGTYLLAASDDVPPFVFLRLLPLSRAAG